jgi:hypothetical protein
MIPVLTLGRYCPAPDHDADARGRVPESGYIGSLDARTNPHHRIMLTDQKVLLFGPLLFSLFLFHHIQRVKQVWQAFGDLPTYSIVVSPLNLLSRLLPRIPWVSDGINFSWENVYERQPLPRLSFSYTAHSPCPGVFAASNSDIVHLRSLFPSKTPHLLVADATTAKVGLVSKLLSLCSIYPSSASFRTV